MPFKTSPQLGWFNLLSTSHLFIHRFLSFPSPCPFAAGCCLLASGGVLAVVGGVMRPSDLFGMGEESSSFLKVQGWRCSTGGVNPAGALGHGFGLLNRDFSQPRWLESSYRACRLPSSLPCRCRAWDLPDTGVGEPWLRRSDFYFSLSHIPALYGFWQAAALLQLLPGLCTLRSKFLVQMTSLHKASAGRCFSSS